VGEHTVGAILEASLCILKVSSTLISQCVQRAVTKQAVKILRLVSLMTRKKFTFLMLKKSIFFISEIAVHNHPPD